MPLLYLNKNLNKITPYMTRSIFISLLLIVVSACSASAQSKKFTGTINYKITYPGSNGSPIMASLPQNISMDIAGNKAKFSLTLPNGSYTFIVNGDETSVTRLIENSDGKFFIKKAKEEFMKGDAPVMLPLKETKTIAGYKCKSAEITATDRGGKSQKSTVYYSEDLGTNAIYFNTDAKAVKGILLDLDYSTMGVPMHLTAVEVKPGRISNKIFEIPAGFKETTEAQLHQMKQANKKK
jgi:hypothetical protein